MPAPERGDIAQQGERGVRNAEVGGSSPPISTNPSELLLMQVSPGNGNLVEMEVEAIVLEWKAGSTVSLTDFSG